MSKKFKIRVLFLGIPSNRIEYHPWEWWVDHCNETPNILTKSSMSIGFYKQLIKKADERFSDHLQRLKEDKA